ncbi:uncharacterized protein NPIL_254271 [Nephila pilipes]|uniref:G-protein coupled receptors family 2 profile 1 domain-containing protein n=1 Tax=Nephila pilipes TaxID=299642 RepID=A0A8X6PHR8_NEPPI|nr:uncharacterized protein NPIL_254271 [Nephila pilipes]
MSLVHLPCPAEKGIDITKFASRQCDKDGLWMGHPEKENINGWSNYSDCFTKEIKLLLDKLYTSSELDVQKNKQYLFKFQHPRTTDYPKYEEKNSKSIKGVELVGYHVFP